MKNHHDNRSVTWHISMHDSEEKQAEARRAETGLSKAEFGRQALMTANVISRVSSEDRKLLNDLSHMRADINRLVLICEKSGVEKAEKRMLNIEDKFSELYNELIARIG